MTYAQLLSATEDRSLREASPPFLKDEMELQSLWFSGLFGDKFTSVCGKEITLINPGEWNRGAGPDFMQASIEVDGEAQKGDLEIDLYADSWEFHGHRENPAFDGVILHVVLHDPAQEFFTRTSQEKLLPRILIPPEALQEALGKPRLSQALARPGRCLQPLAQLGATDLNDLLQKAALHRAQNKARRHRRIARAHNPAQALWESLAEALGYSKNRLPMRLLAQRLPIKKLKNFSPADIEALLFGTAGFLHPELHEQAPTDSRVWLESLWQTWWKHRPAHEFSPERQLRWNRTATRPGNHPQRRLAALACIATNWAEFYKASRAEPPFSSLKKLVSALSHPFWDHHHTLNSHATAKPIALLGSTRLNDFLLNILYPLKLEENPKNWAHFQKIAGGTPNQKVKRACERLFGSLSLAKPQLKKAWQHQALLQVYQDFCLEDQSDCADCPFPEQLANFKQSFE